MTKHISNIFNDDELHEASVFDFTEQLSLPLERGKHEAAF